MNYIYDILVNFKSKLYDFYEWDKADEIVNIRKIPLYRVDKNVLLDFIKNKVVVSDLLEQILNKTEVLKKGKIDKIDYAFILCDNEYAAVFVLDSKGYVINYSSLLIEEEAEVLQYSYNLLETKINYTIIRSNKYALLTREEYRIKNYLYKQINNLISKQEYEKLEYLYLECFANRKNIKNIINNIYFDLEQDWDYVYMKLYNLFKFNLIR